MSERKEKLRRNDEQAPPGEFLSEDLRDETARFLDEIKRRIRNRGERDDEPKLGPPHGRNSA